MIGVDIIEVARIQGAIERQGERFLNRVYTEAEVKYCEARGKFKFESLAGRFAAKEAISKVFGSGIRGISWRDIEILNNAEGKPEVFLHGQAKELCARLKIGKIYVSISHIELFAVAAAKGSLAAAGE
jgi:holo-[acyl-carrier protein] synthase